MLNNKNSYTLLYYKDYTSNLVVSHVILLCFSYIKILRITARLHLKLNVFYWDRRGNVIFADPMTMRQLVFLKLAKRKMQLSHGWQRERNCFFLI